MSGSIFAIIAERSRMVQSDKETGIFCIYETESQAQDHLDKVDKSKLMGKLVIVERYMSFSKNK
jgi:hypothetical protein